MTHPRVKKEKKKKELFILVQILINRILKMFEIRLYRMNCEFTHPWQPAASS